VDGELVDFKDKAFQEAIDRQDYIVFEGPNRQQEATAVSKKISELIIPMRELNKQQVEGRLNFAEGGGPVLPKYIGRSAYENAIQKFAESETDAQLLREFAWVESKFATDPTTFRTDNRSAYQITPIRFKDFTDSLKESSKAGAGLRRYVAKMEKKHNANYRNIQYDDLNNPELATLVTRALLKRIPQPIGQTKEQRAVQWKRDWNTELGAGSEEKYLTDLKYLD